MSCLLHNFLSLFESTAGGFRPRFWYSTFWNLSDVFFDDGPVRVVSATDMTGPTPLTWSFRSFLRFIHWVTNSLDVIASVACIVERVRLTFEAIRAQIFCLQGDVLMAAHSARPCVYLLNNFTVYKRNRLSAPWASTNSVSICVANVRYALNAELD